MAELLFDSTKSFDANFELFLVELEKDDPEMAAILRANTGLLASIITDGERDLKKRAEFNAAVATALDGIEDENPEEQA